MRRGAGVRGLLCTAKQHSKMKARVGRSDFTYSSTYLYVRVHQATLFLASSVYINKAGVWSSLSLIRSRAIPGILQQNLAARGQISIQHPLWAALYRYLQHYVLRLQSLKIEIRLENFCSSENLNCTHDLGTNHLEIVWDKFLQQWVQDSGTNCVSKLLTAAERLQRCPFCRCLTCNHFFMISHSYLQQY